jgi:hypothetical protein
MITATRPDMASDPSFVDTHSQPNAVRAERVWM